LHDVVNVQITMLKKIDREKCHCEFAWLSDESVAVTRSLAFAAM
jgi:hypothetical protein